MANNSTPSTPPPAAPETPASGKGRPTPPRREREAANKRPLVPNDRKEAARQNRAKLAQSREKARIGLANGDERYLPARDKGPQRRFVRDWVDARFSVGELFLPLMVVLIIATFIPSYEVQVYAMLTMYVFIALMILDVVLLGFLVRRKVAAKFGADRVEKGLRWYAAMRALQFRRLRLPKPQVRRGQYPV
ncbi:DUF3043 domain-containing protein [Naasia sp. SYSU D00948]|uniref:DUF3043 domain-containing protein n=1 Tax=Naasia sp. SYSU D00948 TaxID=2817379 RepID=UPI001B304AF0|nr:DUF3043 domain-containing protein [Naasia sp. SYSU D00948]